MGKGGGSAADFYLEMQMDGHGYDSEGEWDPSQAYEDMISASIGSSSSSVSSSANIAEIAREIHLMAWEEEKETARGLLRRLHPHRTNSHRTEHINQAEREADLKWLARAKSMVEETDFSLMPDETARVIQKLEDMAAEKEPAQPVKLESAPLLGAEVPARPIAATAAAASDEPHRAPCAPFLGGRCKRADCPFSHDLTSIFRDRRGPLPAESSVGAAISGVRTAVELVRERQEATEAAGEVVELGSDEPAATAAAAAVEGPVGAAAAVGSGPAAPVVAKQTCVVCDRCGKRINGGSFGLQQHQERSAKCAAKRRR
jgi:hypothetical protein